MSIATIVPQIQGAASSAAIVKNILAGLVPSVSGLDAISILAKDVGGFEFDYIGEERLEAGTEITKHFTETNAFMQDHKAIKPKVLIMRGYVAESTFKRSGIVGSLLSLSSALQVVQPYLGKYSPGTAAKMQSAVTQTDQVINQLNAIAGAGASILKLVGFFSKTKVQEAYDKLEGLRTSDIPFAVVTPWATFGDIPGTTNGPMMIEDLILVAPDETRSWGDIIVRLVEIRTAPSLIAVTQDNARAPGASNNAVNGAAQAK